MQLSAFLSLAFSIPLVHSQSTTAYVGLDPNYPIYDVGPSSVFTAIETGTPTPAAYDPCGPARQPSPNPAGNTCDAPITDTTTPAPYAVQCLNDFSDTNFSVTACVTQTIPAICTKLTDPAVKKGTWVWASADAPDRCYMAFYLPPYDGSAQTPDEDRCVNDIFTPMLGFCNPATGYVETEGMYNLGMVNVKVRPDRFQDGQAVDVGYPSYLLSTRQLTGI